jgi:glycosyltransferase involved in cell wall biosynthesis
MSRAPRILVGIPVYNEQRYVQTVLEEVRTYARDVLVIDDGSTDMTPLMLARQPVEVIRHAENRGYGRSMQDMIRWASFDGFDWLITMDCDEQHEPAAIPRFVGQIVAGTADVISGSRYLLPTPLDDAPPRDRRDINHTIILWLQGLPGRLLRAAGAERGRLRLPDAVLGAGGGARAADLRASRPAHLPRSVPELRRSPGRPR